MNTLYIVIPCYNEQEVLPETTRRLVEKITDMMREGVVSKNSRIVYVDDGSTDNTWQIIENFHQKLPLVCGVKLAHNRGHQNALLAGLMFAKDHCDCAISMDADLQDDINVLDGFMEQYVQGCHVVYGVRNDRSTDTPSKRNSAEKYYKLLSKMGVEVVHNHADCRLLSRTALEELSHYKESNLFLRGIVPHMGFKHATVYYKRDRRFAGKSKYSLGNMISLAWQGITSFSVKPLKAITALGLFLSVISGFSMFLQLLLYVCGIHMSGLFLAVTCLWFLGGILLTALGIVGSYVGKVYEEVKERPRYTYETILHKK